MKYGDGSNGRRRLVKAVMDAGYSQAAAEKAVNAVIAAWKRALKDHETVEMPLGVFKVKKTPKNLYKRRRAGIRTDHKGERRLYTWTIYNDRYRVLWRVAEDQWVELLQK